MEINEVSQMEDGDFAMETCLTRTLPPALTLEHGLERIKEAVEKLKLNPPPPSSSSSTSSGFFRFQVLYSKFCLRFVVIRRVVFGG